MASTAPTRTSTRSAWRTVTPTNPCPICGRSDWCAVAPDHTVVCRRVDTGGTHRIDRAGVDYWIHTTNGHTPTESPEPIPYDPGTPQVGLADPDTLHHAYSTLLDLLSLSSTHRQVLTSRGITGDAITTGQYRTLPTKDRHTLADKVARRVGIDTLTGVPGFHHHPETGDLIVGGKTGLIVPVRDLQGRIVALKLRADTPSDGTPRYTFMSSAHRGGASPGAPVHVPIHQPATPTTGNDSTPVVVRVTEGELKADAATLNDGIRTVSIPGVGAWRKALTLLRDLNTTHVHLAFDADWATNPRVATALAQAAKAMLAAGHEVTIETWPATVAKGIDDLMAAGLRPRAVPADVWLASRGEDPTSASTPTPTTLDTEGGLVTLPPGEYALSDDGNALRLIAAFGDDIRWDVASGSWVTWTGTHWAPDDTFEIVRRARAVARAITREADQLNDPDEAKKVRRWASVSQSKGRLDAMIALAKTDPGIAFAPGTLDDRPGVLNVANGTIDLTTGTLHPHNRDDLLSKISPVVYDPTATHPVWDAFLDDLTGSDPELIVFLQRLVGYSLLGNPTEELLPVLYGAGGTGKSTFVDAIRTITGAYGHTADFESFIDKKLTGVRNDIAALAGSRLVTSIEVDDGKKLAVALVKSITGGDTIRARYLYKEAFEFRPTFVLWLICNHAPAVPHDDSGMWRRILRVPMNRVVLPERRDPRVKATLRDPAVGGPAVLAWAVRGCLDYQRHGLPIPDVVLADTQQYRVEQDPLAGLWGDWLVEDPDGFVANPDLHTAYLAWAKEAGEPRPLTARGLGAVLAGRAGLVSTTKRRDGKVMRGWVGLRLGPAGHAAVTGNQIEDFGSSQRGGTGRS